jgi:RNA-directed DNA polymerase
VLSSITAWLAKTLRLKVNATKSAAAPVEERKFLGYRLLADGRPVVAPESLARLQKKLCDATKRRTPRPVEQVAVELAPLLRGWGTYFRLAHSQSVYRQLDSWIRRRLRAIRLQQCKRVYTLRTYLVSRGVPEHSAWAVALSGKGKWHLARTPQAHSAMPTKWFTSVGLISLEQQHLSLKL